MTEIASFVFLDLETTGLPHLERNKTKITELCFVAAIRRDLENASVGSRPFCSKLSLLFNPEKIIQGKAAEITGLTNAILRKEPVFKSKIDILLGFLLDLPKPVCLVAHNGDKFDYKVLLAEFSDASVKLPVDLLCVDSLKAFRSLITNRGKDNLDNKKIINDSLTDADWSELDISAEDWEIIDSLSSSFAEMATGANELSNTPENPQKVTGHQKKVVKNKNTRPSVHKQKVQKKNMASSYCNIQNYTLSHLYEVLLNKQVVNAHRAEDDCMMLLECVTAVKEFLQWSDNNCRNIHVIEPLDRTKYDKK